MLRPQFVSSSLIPKRNAKAKRINKEDVSINFLLELFDYGEQGKDRTGNTFQRSSQNQWDGSYFEKKEPSAKSMNVPSRQADAGRDLRVVIAAPLGDEIGATPPTQERILSVTSSYIALFLESVTVSRSFYFPPRCTNDPDR